VSVHEGRSRSEPGGNPTDAATGGDATGAASGGAPDEVRARLVRAAAAVFAREGYAGTKIMDIVREARVSTGTVYGRFRSKNDLLREAVVGGSKRGGVLASAAPSLGDLIRAGARLVDRPLYPFEALRLEAYVTARREPEVADALADAYASWREGVEPLVAAAEADGQIDGVDPEAVLFLYRTLYLGMLLHRASGMEGPDTAAWEALVERVMAGLGRGDGDRRPAGGDEIDSDGGAPAPAPRGGE
jgi:AcrR family transcriptional regulator